MKKPKNLVLIAALMFSVGAVTTESHAGTITARGIPGYCNLVWKDTASPLPSVLENAEKRVDADIKKNPKDFGAMFCKANFLINKASWQELLALSAKMEKIASGAPEKSVAYQMLAITHSNLANAAEYQRNAELSRKFGKEMTDRMARGDVVVNVNENRY